MRRLRADAAWWFANSNGAVKLVMLIKVNVQRKEITIEKYDGTQGRAIPSNTQGAWRPRLLTSVVLSHQVNPEMIEVYGANTMPAGTHFVQSIHDSK
jgi:hypothetical protein